MLLYGLVLSPTNAQKVSGFRVVVLKGPSEGIAMLHSLGAQVSATSRNFSRVSVSAVSACLLLTGAMFVLQEGGAISRARLHSRNKSNNKWLGAQVQIHDAKWSPECINAARVDETSATPTTPQ